MSNVFALFVGSENYNDPDLTALGLNIAQFMELISTDVEFTTGDAPDDNLDFGEYFEDFEIFFFCRAGPLDPKLNGFFHEETWPWVHLPGQLPGHPLEYTEDLLQIMGDFNEPPVGPTPEDAVQSLFYTIAANTDPNGPPGNWLYFTEFICRKLEDENHTLAIRHGWSSVIDSSRAIPPDEIAMPVLP